MHTRMDAAVTVDAQTAPTATWKTAQSAVSHSAHTHHPFLSRTHEITAPHTKNLTVPLSLPRRRALRGASPPVFSVSSPLTPFLRL